MVVNPDDEDATDALVGWLVGIIVVIVVMLLIVLGWLAVLQALSIPVR